MQINENFDGGKFNRYPEKKNDDSAIRKQLLNNRISQYFANDGKLDRSEQKMLKQEGFSKDEIKQAIEEYKEFQNDKLKMIEQAYERLAREGDNVKPAEIKFGLS